jgi:hypothetical protein
MQVLMKNTTYTLITKIVLGERVVGDSPRDPLKQTGESPLKTRNKPKPNTPRLSTKGMAHATVALTAHRGGPLKDPLEEPPPRSRVRTALEWAPPRSRALRARPPAPVRGHLMP